MTFEREYYGRQGIFLLATNPLTYKVKNHLKFPSEWYRSTDFYFYANY